MKPGIVGVLSILFVAGCGGSDPGDGEAAGDAAGDSRDRKAIVVYASHADERYWPSLFADFTAETGILVTVKLDTPGEQLQRILDKRDVPAADVYIAADVQGAWRAADEGRLRPYRSAFIDSRVPASLRDADGVWVALSLVHAQVLQDSRQVDGGIIQSYEDLADPALESKLCLSGSSLAINRTVIAHLVRNKGKRDAELLVRGWMANLALPPFDTEEQLVARIADGSCAAGIVSSHLERPIIPGFSMQPLNSVTPFPAFGNGEVVAISRHANEPDAARRLVEWLFTAAVQDRHSAAGRRHAVVPSQSAAPGAASVGGAMNSASQQLGEAHLGVAGWFDSEAVSLAERASYR